MRFDLLNNSGILLSFYISSMFFNLLFKWNVYLIGFLCSKLGGFLSLLILPKKWRYQFKWPKKHFHHFISFCGTFNVLFQLSSNSSLLIQDTMGIEFLFGFPNLWMQIEWKLKQIYTFSCMAFSRVFDGWTQEMLLSWHLAAS